MVAPVIDKVEIAVVELAAYELEMRIGLGLGILEVGFKVQCGENFAELLTCVDTTFADGVYTGSVAEEFANQPVKLCLVIGEAGIIEGLRSGNDRTIFN